MTILILGAAVALSIFAGAWSCGCLTLWLLRHRRIRVPCYRTAKATLAHQGTSEANGHPRAKPEWVRQQVLYLAVHLDSCRKRRLLCLKALPRKCVLTLLGHLFLVLAQYGLPTAIRTDNESMFTSQLWGVTLKALGILLRRSPPGQPWRNGRIERLFGTLKPLLRKIGPSSVAVLQNTLAEFSHFYNHVRPHQNLGGLTPLEAWQGKCLADVQQVHTQAQGQWVQALDGLLVGYHVRC